MKRVLKKLVRIAFVKLQFTLTCLSLGPQFVMALSSTEIALKI